VWGITRRRKGGDHTLAVLKSIRAARPGGYRHFLIMDNLSANKTPAIRAWAGRANVELCFTPTSASWANPIEAQFEPLRTFTMASSDHPNHTVLARRLQDYTAATTVYAQLRTAWGRSEAYADLVVTEPTSPPRNRRQSDGPAAATGHAYG
jgi:DDE superfamily endonuclease